MRNAVLSLLLAFAHLASHATVDATVETRQYWVPGQGPRIEVNMAFLGHSLVLLPNEMGAYRSRVAMLVLVEQNEAIVTYAKSEVTGPDQRDSVGIDLLHQEYFDLRPGEYDMVLEMRDLNSADTTVTRTRFPLVVSAPGDGIFFSDILLAESVQPAREGEASRNGYRAIPLVSTYYPTVLGTLTFYAELYNTAAVFGPDSLYMLTYQIEQFESGKVYGSFRKVQRNKAKQVEVIIATFDIRDLPSGNYQLALEVRDRQGVLQARAKQFIQRNNPVSYDATAAVGSNMPDLSGTFAGAMTDADTLAENIRSMRPVADDLERKIIDDRLKDKDVALMQRFFYSFWYNRNGYDPASAWKAYEQEVVKVNRLYGSRVKKGYETDRGYVHLKYGAPNSIMDRPNEMDAYPYQIWHYYRCGNYTNRRFVFYLPDLVTNDYVLLHSDMRGEVLNPRWNQIIHSRNTPMNNVGVEKVNSASGERADEFYEMPR